jgi:putative transposon-encoded protein
MLGLLGPINVNISGVTPMEMELVVTTTRIESVVTASGNIGHVAVTKPWIGKEAIVTLEESKVKGNPACFASSQQQ